MHLPTNSFGYDAALQNSGEMPTVDFQTFGKIARFRECVITEKLDGTNAAVGILPFTFGTFVERIPVENCATGYANLYEYGGTQGAIVPGLNDIGDDGIPQMEFFVYAQSRTRLITPEKDNYGFARWVNDHAQELVYHLGGGLHFGEWWGQGIQRKYGMDKKVFSLFNTHRWGWIRERAVEHGESILNGQLSVVPELYAGDFTTENVDATLRGLEHNGSYAAPGFDNPEGVVVYLRNANTMFKKTLNSDGGKYSQ